MLCVTYKGVICFIFQYREIQLVETPPVSEVNLRVLNGLIQSHINSHKSGSTRLNTAPLLV